MEVVTSNTGAGHAPGTPRSGTPSAAPCQRMLGDGTIMAVKIAPVLGAAAVAAALLSACSEDGCRGVATYGVDENGKSFASCDESSDDLPASPATR